MIHIALTSFLLLQAAPPAKPVNEPQWWVFLDKGPHREDRSKEWLEAGQKAHIANLTRLWHEGRSQLAGPLGDDGQIRGIVLLRATSREALLAQFEGDPFVATGRLAVRAWPWDGSLDILQPPGDGLQEASLAIVTRGPAWKADAADAEAAHRQVVTRLEASGLLALHGRMKDTTDVEETLIFRSKDHARVRSLLEADPAVQSGHFAVSVHPQYLGAGMLGPEPH